MASHYRKQSEGIEEKLQTVLAEDEEGQTWEASFWWEEQLVQASERETG